MNCERITNTFVIHWIRNETEFACQAKQKDGQSYEITISNLPADKVEINSCSLINRKAILRRGVEGGGGFGFLLSPSFEYSFVKCDEFACSLCFAYHKVEIYETVECSAFGGNKKRKSLKWPLFWVRFFSSLIEIQFRGNLRGWFSFFLPLCRYQPNFPIHWKWFWYLKKKHTHTHNKAGKRCIQSQTEANWFDFLFSFVKGKKSHGIIRRNKKKIVQLFECSTITAHTCAYIEYVNKR